MNQKKAPAMAGALVRVVFENKYALLECSTLVATVNRLPEVLVNRLL